MKQKINFSDSFPLSKAFASQTLTSRSYVGNRIQKHGRGLVRAAFPRRLLRLGRHEFAAKGLRQESRCELLNLTTRVSKAALHSVSQHDEVIHAPENFPLFLLWRQREPERTHFVSVDIVHTAGGASLEFDLQTNVKRTQREIEKCRYHRRRSWPKSDEVSRIGETCFRLANESRPPDEGNAAVRSDQEDVAKS